MTGTLLTIIGGIISLITAFLRNQNTPEAKEKRKEKGRQKWREELEKNDLDHHGQHMSNLHHRLLAKRRRNSKRN